MDISRNRILVAALVVGSALAGVAAALFLRYEPPLELGDRTTLLEHPRATPEVRLVDQDGEAFTRERLQGRWNLLFFGFTHCPDVCPTTLYQAAEVVGRMQERGTDAPQVIFVSVDPMRDTPERLAEYVPYFHPDFVGVTGELSQLQPLFESYGVAYGYQQREGDEGYDVDHTASLFLVGPDGRLQALFLTPHETGRLVSDIAAIMERRS